jgi:hypothetical protein
VLPCENPINAIDFYIRIPSTVSSAAYKQQLINTNALTNKQPYDFDGTLRSGWISPSLLATVRVIQASTDEDISKIGNAFVGKMISVKNEASSYKSLKDLLVARMNVDSAEVSF